MVPRTTSFSRATAFRVGHAHFEQRGPVWVAVDDNSTNGTYVNDEPISRELGLTNGDRVKVGPTIFKYLSGQDVEAQYHEEYLPDDHHRWSHAGAREALPPRSA